MPKFWAKEPKIYKHNAIIPQQNPLINPAIMLLYCGNAFCASTNVTGCANIVVNPIKPNITIDSTGCDL